MEAKVEKMELDLRKLRLAQTRQRTWPSTTAKFSNVPKLVDEIDTQIKTQQTELDLQKGVDSDAAVEKALTARPRPPRP